MSWNEARLHEWIQARLGPRRGQGRIGNDAAVLRAVRTRPVVCVDATIEGVHFEASASARSVGRKACARSLSDLAASAARPVAVLASVVAPKQTRESWIQGALQGVQACARAHGAELAGGDLSCARGPRALVVTAIGELPRGVRPVSRSAARPLDVVVLTGPTGGSLLGRHLRILPRVHEGLWLARSGARAMMDTSDGLALDLSRMARASRVRIDLERVPVHRDAARTARRGGRSARERALHDGEDHELIAALGPAALLRVLREAPRRCPALRVIGRVRAGSGLWIRGEDGRLARWSGRGGWIHGA